LTLLLNDVSKFVGDEHPPSHCMWLILLRTEYDIGANGVGAGLHLECGGSGFGVGEDANVTEIVPEAGFHPCARCRVKRFAARRRTCATRKPR
jgi:hypothetical protein